MNANPMLEAARLGDFVRYYFHNIKGQAVPDYAVPCALAALSRWGNVETAWKMEIGMLFETQGHYMQEQCNIMKDFVNRYFEQKGQNAPEFAMQTALNSLGYFAFQAQEAWRVQIKPLFDSTPDPRQFDAIQGIVNKMTDEYFEK